MKIKVGLLALTLGILNCVAATPANAQNSVSTKARSKVEYYHAPHEIQILDERPMIKDFREAPSAAGQIQLPPGPGSGPGYGGGGGGAMGGDDGSPLPAGGMQIGGGGPGYRTDPNAGGMNALPKSGFGGPSNIPARGMGPRGPLPGGFSTNQLAGKVKAWTPTSPMSAGPAMAGRSYSRPVPAGPTAASYNPPVAMARQLAQALAVVGPQPQLAQSF